jgi:hypothetical protein
MGLRTPGPIVLFNVPTPAGTESRATGECG